MEKAFEFFTFNGKNFLAIPQDYSNVAISDDEGNNYGSWYSIESFKEHRHHEILGKVKLVKYPSPE